MKKLSDINKRFLAVLKEKNMPPYKLEEATGLNRQIVYNLRAGKNDPSRETVNTLLAYFSDINPDWLNLGKGNMYLNTEKNFIIHEDKPNILETYSIDDIVSFVIENEKELLKNSLIFKEYLKLKENEAVFNYLKTSLNKLSS
ncbi:MAG: helix-turn-helix transcriptional regulator [Endomicrobium sp.]|jgi:transcriptional regulator with XRE-family HTH domain|nr:helix-turn-helix transcriptional regulator [Endomicrobium sp.]